MKLISFFLISRFNFGLTMIIWISIFMTKNQYRENNIFNPRFSRRHLMIKIQHKYSFSCLEKILFLLKITIFNMDNQVTTLIFMISVSNNFLQTQQQITTTLKNICFKYKYTLGAHQLAIKEKYTVSLTQQRMWLEQQILFYQFSLLL